MICMSWVTRCKEDGVVTPTWWYASHVPPGNCKCPRCTFLRTLDSLKQPGDDPPGPSSEGLRAIMAAHGHFGRIGQVHPTERHQRGRQTKCNRGNAGALSDAKGRHVRCLRLRKRDGKQTERPMMNIQ